MSEFQFPTPTSRVLVLGGCGFIGSHLVDALLAANIRVRCFDRADIGHTGTPRGSNLIYEFFAGDLASDADIASALEGCDVCVHLVSTTLPQSSNADPVYDVESNVVGTLGVLKHAVTAGVKKVVFVSSGGTVYGVPRQIPIPETHPTEPTVSYGITKLTIEKYLALFHTLHGLNYTVLRLANPFGERQRTQSSQGAVAVFAGKALRGEEVQIWGNGNVVRDYIYISDVVEALVAAIRYSGTEHIFNIGSGSGKSLNEVLDAIDQAIGHRIDRRYLPGRVFDVPRSVLDIERARHVLGWVPRTSFEDGLRRFIAWLSAGEADIPGPDR